MLLLVLVILTAGNVLLLMLVTHNFSFKNYHYLFDLEFSLVPCIEFSGVAVINLFIVNLT